MYCSNCGTFNDDNNFRCIQCGTVIQQVGPGPQQPYAGVHDEVPNHLVMSILVTLFCCQILGIVALVYSSQVGSKLAAGDYEGAVQASSNAKTWATIGAVSGFIVLAIYMIFMFAVGIQGL